MKWTHLPLAGGLYDQDPDLLDKFEYIFRKIAEREQQEREKEEAERRRNEAAQKRQSARRPSMGRGRRR